ncbi:MAG: response regulator [Arcobacteraceae bacterium]|jgi:PAS domain S-box-containing protein|nr:response regulator [Arcobacteraceae bacterium]
MATFDISELRTITILYVEDESALRKQETRIYNKIFKEVFEAEDGVEALEIFKNNQDKIDVIITDINMPKMSGLDLAREIQHISDVPIIITTAYTNTEYMLESLDLGIKKFINKPITINRIIQDIEKVVVQHRKEKNVKDIAKTLITKTKNDSKELSDLLMANKELEKNLTYYKQLADRYIQMMTVNKNGEILEVSSRFSELMGYSESELMGENISILKENNSGISIQKEMLEAIHKKTTIDSIHEFTTKEGKPLKFKTKMVLFYGDDLLIAGYNFYLELIH